MCVQMHFIYKYPTINLMNCWINCNQQLRVFSKCIEVRYSDQIYCWLICNQQLHVFSKCIEVRYSDQNYCWLICNQQLNVCSNAYYIQISANKSNELLDKL